MKKFKCKKVFTCFLLLFSCASIITSCTILNTRKVNVSNDLQSHNQDINTKVGNQSFQINFGDIVDSYTDGYNVYELNRITIASDISVGNDEPAPNLDDILVDIYVNKNSNQLEITNTHGSNASWEKLSYDAKNMQPDFELDPPKDSNSITKNFFKLTEFNSTTPFTTPGKINWNNKQTDPSQIQGQVGLNTQNTLLLQIGIHNTVKTEKQKYKIFVNYTDNSGQELWVGGNKKDFGCGSLFSDSTPLFWFEGIVMQDIADGNKIKLFIPNENTARIKTENWKFSNDGQKFLSLQDAFDAFEKDKSLLRDRITFKPTLCTNSMSGFPISVVMNEKQKRLEFNYGTNNDFKYVFYGKSTGAGSPRHIYPFVFDTSSYEQSSLYINVKKQFESYNEGISILGDLVTKGTYIKPGIGEALKLKYKYASQVPVDEIKNEILSHIINKPDNFTIDNIILKPNDAKSKLEFDNNLGEIRFNIVLTKYFDDNGDLQQNEQGYIFKPNEKIEGFTTIAPTEAKNKVINVGDSSLIASEQTPSDIAKLVIKNKRNIFTTLAEDIDPTKVLSESDLKVNIIKAVNSVGPTNPTGYLEAKIKVNANFLTKPNSLIATSGEFIEFELKVEGYKTIQSTIFHQSINLSQSHGHLLATDFGNEASIKKLYNANKSLFVVNLPDDSEPIFNITQVSNIVSPEVDNGNSGFIKVNITFKKIYDEEGNIKVNITKSYVIFGFKKITPTVIQEFVNIRKPNELVTEILNGTAEENTNKVKQIIDQNRFLFFGESTLPDNLLNELNVNIIKIKNTTSESEPWQLEIELTLNKYFNANGYPQTTPPLTKKVKISGYKTVEPTDAHSKTFFIQDSYYKNLYPYQLEKNNFALLKEIIINQLTSLDDKVITGDLPSNPLFNTNDIVIVTNANSQIPDAISKPILNNKTGSVEFTFYIKRWYSYPDGKLESLKDDNYAKGAPFATITIRGLQSSQETTVNFRNPLRIPKTSEYELLRKTSAGEVANILQLVFDNKNSPEPESILSSEQKSILRQFKLFLYNEGFSGFKLPFDEKKSIIIEPIKGNKFEAENLTGLLKEINFKMLGYMESTGNVVEDQYITASGKRVEGFNSINPTRINTAYELHKKAFKVPASYSSITPNYIYENNELANVIKAYDEDLATPYDNKIILGDIPKQFVYADANDPQNPGSLIISNVVVDTELSTIKFTLRINCFYSDVNGEVETPETSPPSDPVEIMFEGFKQISSTTINGEIVTSDFIYPTITNQTKNVMEVKIQQKSNARFLTPSAFIDSIDSLTNNTEQEVQENINNLLHFTESNLNNNVVSQPVIIFNPDSRHKMTVDGIVYNTINDEQGYIIFTLRIRGFFYNRSTEPTKIVNDKGEAYAYINVKLKGFKPLLLYLEQNKNSTFIIPVLASGIIFIIFLIIIIMKFSMKSKRKETIDKDMFFEG